jgi:hypothetical protein
VTEVDQFLDRVRDVVDRRHLDHPLLLDEGLREVLLGGEVEVQSTLGDARPGQDVREARAGEAARLEDFGGRVEDGVARAFGTILPGQLDLPVWCALPGQHDIRIIAPDSAATSRQRPSTLAPE